MNALTKVMSHLIEGLITTMAIFLAMGSFFWFNSPWAKLSGFAVRLFSQLLGGEMATGRVLNAWGWRYS